MTPTESHRLHLMRSDQNLPGKTYVSKRYFGERDGIHNKAFCDACKSAIVSMPGALHVLRPLLWFVYQINFADNFKAEAIGRKFWLWGLIEAQGLQPGIIVSSSIDICISAMATATTSYSGSYPWYLIYPIGEKFLNLHKS